MPSMDRSRLLICLSAALLGGCGSTDQDTAAAPPTLSEYRQQRLLVCQQFSPEQQRLQAQAVALEKRGLRARDKRLLDRAADLYEQANRQFGRRLAALDELPTPSGKRWAVETVTRVERWGLRLGWKMVPLVRAGNHAAAYRLYERYSSPNPGWARARSALGLETDDC